jgi:hypothetical protein
LGCIRMLNSDVIEVFNQVEVGTPVVIRWGVFWLSSLLLSYFFLFHGLAVPNSVQISVVHY